MIRCACFFGGGAAGAALCVVPGLATWVLGTLYLATAIATTTAAIFAACALVDRWARYDADPDRHIH